MLDRQFQEAALQLIYVGDRCVIVSWVSAIDSEIRNLDLESASAARLVVAGVYEESVHPGFETVQIAKRSEVAPRSNQRFLDSVLRAVAVAQHAARDRVQLVVESGGKGIKRVVIPLLRALDECRCQRAPLSACGGHLPPSPSMAFDPARILHANASCIWAHLQSGAMHDAPPPAPLPALRPPDQPTLATSDPDVPDLFQFMTEAELRFETLRMRIIDKRTTTHGEEVEKHELWLRHPGMAKVISTRGTALERDYDAWVSDGDSVHTYDARANTATSRRVPVRPVGAEEPSLPSFSKIYLPVTTLPAETLADTFVHPRGFCRNVLSTGVVTQRGTATIAGREAFLLRCDHPRTSHVLTDRPDHWLEVGVDLQTGVILLLAEHIGDQVTRHAEVTTFAVDEPISDDVFRLHISSDTRILY